MASVSKKGQEINNSLDALYQVNNGEKIISWLDMLKTYNSTDGKIPGLLNSCLLYTSDDADDQSTV
jgi:hypothetical protein